MSKDDRPGILERSTWGNFSYKESGNRVFPKRDLPTVDLELARAASECEGLEQRHCSLFENASVGIYQIAPDGTIIRVNPALAQLLGYSSPEQLTAAIANLKQQLYVDSQQHQSFIELMYERGSLSDFQSRVYRRDGSIIWISETVCSILDAENKLIYYEGFVSDITQLKETEQALRKLEAKHNSKVRLFKNTAKLLQQSQTQLRHREKLSTLGQLLAEVAHEIKNPVTFVCGNVSPATHYARDLILLLQLYQKHYPQPDPEIAEFARDIDLDFIVGDLPKTLGSMKMGIDRICNLVRSLQRFSRFDDERIKPTNLHKSLDSTLLILNSRLKANGQRPSITVIKDYGNLPQDVFCYGSLERVFMNLLANAIDALEEAFARGQLKEQLTLWIKTEVSADGSVLIRIRDNGIGMSEETQAKIFDSFFTTKSIDRGTGLGLAICSQIVTEKHGGQLTCVSAPGQGTEFVVKISLLNR